MFVVSMVLLIFLSNMPLCVCNELSDEARLYRDLSKIIYYRRARPVKNSTRVVNVTLNLQLLSLNINIRQQRMMSSIWLEHRWKDEIIHWNTSDYGGVNVAIWMETIYGNLM